MLPTRLELKNFLPYRSPDAIYFEGIDLACLTGNNGAGKSSLLDAITWALWGKARGKRDDDLVHLGQPEMYVQLDFEQEGTIYRVLRRRKSGKRGQGELNLWIVQEGGELLLISEPSMRQTQQKIDTLLRLDYDTFVNSAFLQQGKADAFTTKTPAERKKILSDILGLEQWGVYEDRTKEMLKALNDEVKAIDGVLQSIDEEIAREPQYKRELETAEKNHAVAVEARDEAKVKMEALQDAPTQLSNARQNISAVQGRVKRYREDLEAVQNEINKSGKRVEEYETLIAQAETIQTGYDALQSAREESDALSSKLSTLNSLDKERNQLQNDLTQLKNKLETEREVHRNTIASAQKQLDSAVDDEMRDIQTKITELEEKEAERGTLQSNISTLQAEKGNAEATLTVLVQEGKDLNERIAVLEETEGATCPLCGQALDDEHREEILSTIIEERDTMREDYRNTQTRITENNDAITDTNKQIDDISRTLAQLPRLRSQFGALEQQQKDADSARKQLEAAEAALAVVEKTLEDDDYGHEIRQQIATLDEQREALDIGDDAQEAIQSRLAEYREYERQHSQLELAQQQLPDEQKRLDDALARQTRLNNTLEEEAALEKQLTDDITTYEKQAAEYREAALKHGERVTEERTAFTRVNNANQALQSLEYQRKRRAEKETERDLKIAEANIYEELKLAFGKKGVPAMIIEVALPELEASANELLTRMTGGKMHIRMKTQRETLSGNVNETLEIEIADELGTRPYEMYSGGEAFRINFAIRVALSKMLARRAGAQLRTLFIDEGFGTQDDEGRNRLVEAITAIQHDFDMILVITHIDELKDAFPVHIMVEKTGSGSRVTLR